MNKEQRDPGLNELLYPFYTVQKATELMQKFEIDDSMKKKSNFNYIIKTGLKLEFFFKKNFQLRV